ncbi:LemA protein [Candidatus Planktophila dulcis]|jgi:LemA protein|uniref:LemA protein n=1 Tax=Candidatus Planktophila dulcis TaxID=1884914 RepID=A0AAC9YU91_9ACTN|nr:LemA family protein [Candidatus Planktophila dulcis]ASY12637.1 LemA protein [Candidatus Planktophila dulcis]ASY15206.1 LemA protein [Candidatus Planktophila dulcis]ASY21886.1 LemA protein [Candidatus Planktophila dulcis]MCX6435811.1 LemA family protein [Actinomycetota bacterium]
MEFIVIGALVLLVIFAVAQYNRLIRLNITVDEAFAQIEVQLKRRADLIPNLVETVKGYAAHEQGTFDAVVAARAKSTSASTVADVAAADGALTNALRGLLAVAEAYPDLKASSNFLSLQEELSTTENKVSFSRQFYNDTVRSLNTAVKTVPTNFFAGFAKVDAREFYEVENAADRNVPNVKF